MSIEIIEGFKEIDIEHQYGQRQPFAGGAAALLDGKQIERATIGDVGHRVGGDQDFQVPVRQLEILIADRQTVHQFGLFLVVQKQVQSLLMKRFDKRQRRQEMK